MGVSGRYDFHEPRGLLRFSGEGRKRGVLTPKEAALVFAAAWNDKRCFAANLLSITTGLRSGEVLALRKSDISGSENILFVEHSWNLADKLKSTKNGESRKVPLLPEVKNMLLELINENPYQGKVENPFIFYGMAKDNPMCNRLLLDSFKEACREVGNNPDGWNTDPAKINTESEGSLWMIRGEKNAPGEIQGKWTIPEKVTEKELLSLLDNLPAAAGENHTEVRYKRAVNKPDGIAVINPAARNIVFHSHRHYYAARMMDRMTAEQVSRITGHKSMAVFAEYADHIIAENLEAAGAIGAEVFGNILSFRKGAQGERS
jgi:integrase